MTRNRAALCWLWLAISILLGGSEVVVVWYFCVTADLAALAASLLLPWLWHDVTQGLQEMTGDSE